MQKKVQREAEKYKKQRQRRSTWRKFVRAMACVVVFCTTYALILPAITMEKYQCGFSEEHTHSASCYEKVVSEIAMVSGCGYETLNVHIHTGDCYDGEQNLVCGFADFLVHTHDDSCVDEEGHLLCKLPQIRAHEHTEECYQVIAADEEAAAEMESEEDQIHHHDDTCYTLIPGQLICQEEESETHSHADGCYETISELTCPLEETTSAEEAESAAEEEPAAEAEPELICNKEVIRLHTHTDVCYEIYQDEEGNQQKRLICPELEIREHIHGETCFTEETVTRGDVDTLTCALAEGHVHGDACYDPEGLLICQETENHIHGDLCYGTWILTCTLEEHTHTAECKPTNVACLCGLVQHSHDGDCYDEEEHLICQLAEHEESPLCSLDPMDRDRVTSVIDEINFILSADEIDRGLAEYEEAEDYEGLDAWSEQVVQDVNFAYSCYANLPEELKAYVTNADKLLELEYIWSASTFAGPSNVTISEFGKDFILPVNFVNRRGETNPRTDAWQVYIFTKQYVSAGRPEDYFQKFINSYNNGSGTYPYYRCYVVAQSDTRLYIKSIVQGNNLKPSVLLEKLGTADGFFVITNTRTLGSTNSGDYYFTQNATVDPAFDWKAYDNNSNLFIQDSEFFSTINMNASPFSIDAVPGGTLNATVSMFNYDETINDYDETSLYRMSRAGYLFYQSDNVKVHAPGEEEYPSGNTKSKPDPKAANEYAKDGRGGREDGVKGGNGIGVAGEYTSPVMYDTLTAAGYPQAQFNGTPATMQLYFDHNGKYFQGSMEDGGGLFRQDSEGYWYYDSKDTAAYYNAKTNRFTLYDCAVGPYYIETLYGRRPYVTNSGIKLDQVNMGNFLPFNDITPETVYLAVPDNPWGTRFYKTDVSNLDLKNQTYFSLREPVDLWFGMTVDVDFYMPKDGIVNGKEMTFDFKGDDDVFVYLGVWNEETRQYDYRLVLDIGGTHAARVGIINFATGAVQDRPATAEGIRHRTLKDIFPELKGKTFEDYSRLSLKFYYMERGGNISYCRLRFNLPTLPKKSLTVTKEVVFEDADQGLQDYVSSAYEYSFRVVEADADGNPTTIPFLSEGTPFTILEGGAAVGTGTVGEDGVFTLRGGQSAQFEDVLGGHGSAHYVVQELIDDTIEGQYKDVWYTINGGTNTETKGEKDTARKFTSNSTGALENSESEFVNFRNMVTTEKLAKLQITKKLAPGATFENNKSFPIEVTLGGRKFPAGAPYKVGSTTKNADANGIIWLKIGETAKIEGILAGTEYSVREVEGEGYITSYEGETSGVLDMGETVQVTVLNADYLMETSLPVRKTYVGNSDPATFQFGLDQTDQNGNVIALLEGTSISMTGTTGEGRIYIKYSSGIQDGTYYYRIYEKAGSLSAIYDTRVYNVEVEVTNSAATVTKVNGAAYDGSSPLEFVNQKLVNVPISKTVTGNVYTEGLTFQFTAKITHNGATFRPAENKSYTIQSDGTVKFTMKANETLYIRGVPVGAKITITEASDERFIPTFTVNGVATEGNTVTTTVLEKSNGIHCNNEGSYRLPNTGGAGTTNYTMAGLVLIILSVTYLMYRFLARRREGSQSP